MNTKSKLFTLSILKPNGFTRFILLSLATCLPRVGMAATYCASGGGYLNINMSMAQVKQACGAPIHTSKKQSYGSRNIAVQQLVYNLDQQQHAYGTLNMQKQTGYGTFTVDLHSPPKINLTITIVANKVSSINLNGSSTLGASVCPNGAIKVGSPVGVVKSACGTPSYVNHSYQQISQGNIVKQEIWTMKTNEYAPSLRLTFENGILKSIQKQ